MGDWCWTDGEGTEVPGTYEKRLLDEFNRLTVCGTMPFALRSPGSQQTVNTKNSYECLGKVLRRMAG